MTRAAVIGAGPAGFYATDDLLQAGFAVDLYEALPTPYGLVRAGVAPDHPKIKSVTRVYERTARHDGFRFFGGVELGRDVSREELLARYHAIVYAVGTATDKRLGIPGEDRPGSVAATELVAWYNGHPRYAEHELDLDCERAVVIGNGNVAIDVARMLVLGQEELRATDVADHAIPALTSRRVREVVILGRRGPAHASFTNPELRELGALAHADVIVDPDDLECSASQDLTTVAQRNLEILRGYAAAKPHGRSYRIVLRFLRSPVALEGAGRDGPVEGVRVARNAIVDGRAVPTGDRELIACGLVVRAIGYRGRPLPGVPFDEDSGVIPNAGGRVLGDQGEPLAGEYVVGWIKRGPSGVIGTNKKDAAATTAKIIEDAAAGRLDRPVDDSDVVTWLRERVGALATWSDWEAIDAHEVQRGQEQGRPRVKLVSVPEMLAVAAQGPSQGSTRPERAP